MCWFNFPFSAIWQQKICFLNLEFLLLLAKIRTRLLLQNYLIQKKIKLVDKIQFESAAFTYTRYIPLIALIKDIIYIYSFICLLGFTYTQLRVEINFLLNLFWVFRFLDKIHLILLFCVVKERGYWVRWEILSFFSFRLLTWWEVKIQRKGVLGRIHRFGLVPPLRTTTKPIRITPRNQLIQLHTRLIRLSRRTIITLSLIRHIHHNRTISLLRIMPLRLISRRRSSIGGIQGLLIITIHWRRYNNMRWILPFFLDFHVISIYLQDTLRVYVYGLYLVYCFVCAYVPLNFLIWLCYLDFIYIECIYAFLEAWQLHTRIALASKIDTDVSRYWLKLSCSYQRNS